MTEMSVSAADLSDEFLHFERPSVLVSDVSSSSRSNHAPGHDQQVHHEYYAAQGHTPSSSSATCSIDLGEYRPQKAWKRLANGPRLQILSKRWPSHLILSNIVSFIARDFLGYGVDFVSDEHATVANTTSDIEQLHAPLAGDIDIENWNEARYSEDDVYILGRTGFTGRSGVFMPDFINQQHANWSLDWFKPHRYDDRIHHLFPQDHDGLYNRSYFLAENTTSTTGRLVFEDGAAWAHSWSPDYCQDNMRITFSRTSSLVGSKPSTTSRYLQRGNQQENVLSDADGVDEYSHVASLWDEFLDSHTDGANSAETRQNKRSCGQIMHEHGYDIGRVEQLVNNHRLPYHVKYATPQEKLHAIVQANFQRRGLLFYHWEPDPLFVYFPSTRVNFPPYHLGCLDEDDHQPGGGTTCDFEGVNPKIIVKREAARHFSDLMAVLKLLSKRGAFDSDAMKEVFKKYLANGAVAAACDWVQTNVNLIKSLIPTCPLDPETLQCACSAGFDPNTGMCLPRKPDSDEVAREVTAGLSWRVMPVIDPPFVIRNINNTERPYSGFIIDLWERLAARASMKTIYVHPDEDATYNTAFDAVVKRGEADMTLGAHFLTAPRGVREYDCVYCPIYNKS
jgi:hypothetical protein